MRSLKLLFACSILLSVSVSLVAQPKPWNVPTNYVSMKNPVAVSDASTQAGQVLYTKNCASCHGKTGLGDGVKARALKDFPGDFSKAEFHAETDGALFYKSKIGRAEMPSYEGKLSDTDIWNIVNYMRKMRK
jgi:mono/diheme cytochrome c family protein